MSLSQENIDKLCMTGIYKCEPVRSWLPSWRRDNPYHCINWTFKVRQYSDGTYVMYDTYWSGSDGFHVELTNENFDKFELLFDLNEMQRISPPDYYDYDEEDRYHLALDSGGYQYSKYYFVRKGAKKNKEKELDRLNRELESLKRQVKLKEEEIERAKRGD